MIDFTSERNEVLINPRLPANAAEELLSPLQKVALTGHVFALTSGSTSGYKWVALSKSAVLASARAVNAALAVTTADRWFHTLPDFHVGGLGIRARAHLSGAEIVEPSYDRWDPFAFQRDAAACTLVSLVPAQVHDLVEAGLRPWPELRTILVGGGAFAGELADAARDLGWPVRGSYGMTEAASTIAIQPPQGGELKPLDHIEIRIGSEDRIEIRSDALFTGYVQEDGSIRSPKDADGWFPTDDYGRLTEAGLTITGRVQDRIKIGGELVDLTALRRAFDEGAPAMDTDYALLALPDPRLETIIALAVAGNAPRIEAAIAEYDRRVPPFARIREVFQVAEIPRSELGKVRMTELLEAVRKPSAEPNR